MGRKVVIAAVAVPAGLALLLGAEVLLAVNGPRLPQRDPLELSGLVGVASSVEPLRMAWVGDSVVAGVGASGPEATVPHLVATGLRRPVRLDVFAVSGERVAGAISDLVPRLERLAQPPQVVVVEIGANDVTHLTGLDEFRAAYDELMARVAAVGAEHVFALGIPAFHTTPRFLQPLRAIVGWRARRIDEQVRESAHAFDATYVNISGETGDVFGAEPDRYYASDDFHPSDAGYELWAAAVLQALE
ncbi:MAG: SGNH/GDSL hydrolase family protein, partial [Actinomycetota bacterium]